MTGKIAVTADPAIMIFARSHADVAIRHRRQVSIVLDCFTGCAVSQRLGWEWTVISPSLQSDLSLRGSVADVAIQSFHRHSDSNN
ncbi:hypothetical protein [uncultured Nitrosomonas sp.]|uniref:hypothetical protein n=1 Tax=uncultured Nitrosomonas sp. TaxID=156424 RepID=UPI002637327B|nr:hypothetical protein [uncultured Nitrosomonas sp.]